MSDIAELERRITAALERIGRGIERGPGPALAPDPELLVPEADRAALIAERDAALAQAQAARDETGQLQAAVSQLTRQLDGHGLDMQRMRKTVIQLRETLRGLREAQAAALPDPGLINTALIAELEALRTERQADLIEMEAIIAELKPLTAEVQDA
jgi:DNA repair exonuclease SbcCD ATPase subunit